MKIAYICYEVQARYEKPGITDEDTLLLQFLQEKGMDIHAEIWTDPAVNWQQYDLAVLKSPWDYIDKLQEFYQWLDKMESYNIRLLNPYNTVRWNSDKHYLGEMIEKGFPVIPAAFIEKGEKVDITPYFKQFNTDKLVVKPCVSGGAKNTFVVTKDKDITATLQPLVQEEAFMVQPFMNEIQSEGEWSFLFFNGVFSHCLLKTAVDGDFRIQHQFGGKAVAQTPPAAHLETAASFVHSFAQGCLYARVDGIVKDGQFLLMELELIEPLLFMFVAPQGYENYYRGLNTIIK